MRLFGLIGLVGYMGILGLTSCSNEDDKIVIQTEHTWVDKKVAVVYPNRNAMTKAQLERTAQWFLDNFQSAQLSGDVCVRLQLEWYDELSGNIEALSTQLANDTSIVAIVGPFNSNSVEVFAEACQQTQKPLIAPTATSEEIIRRYAVPTQAGARTVQPFLWSLTETDVAFTEVMMSAQAALDKSLYIDESFGALLSPDDVYGKTFFDWMPFQSDNLGIDLANNVQYSSTDQLVTRMKDLLDEEYVTSLFTTNFCVVESIDQMVQVARLRRQWILDLDEENKGIPIDDPKYDGYAAYFESFLRCYFAFSDFSQEELTALSDVDRGMLQFYQGFSPYADPTTGFELAYEERYGVKPTFEECKFYDGLMLAAFATYYHIVCGDGNSQLSTPNSQLNQAIYDLCYPNDDAALSTTVWNATAMKLYLESLRNGRKPMFRGASGNISFDPENCTPGSGTTYTHWQIVDGQIQFLRYFSSKGNHRMGEATAAWKYLYDENEALKRLSEQASDADVGIDYAPLTDQYAVLVHASEGFTNYRHLADVLNVYQLLKRNGFDDDHIILIADRSVADDQKNPEPGVVRTAPDGSDLMAGVQIDYDSSELTAADIARILTGQRTDYLPVVLPSDAGNNVFVYWSGHGRSDAHGGSDEFQWRDGPRGLGLTSQLLRQAVTMMQKANSFRKLLIVAEPCYAECVVNLLDGIPGVLAMTGSSAQEQSWADNWNQSGNFWMCDRFTSNFVAAISEQPAITYRDLYLYCAQHTLGSHARIVNAANFGNLYHTGPAEFVKKQ